MKNVRGLFEYEDAVPILNVYQTRIIGYSLEVRHTGLHEYKRLTAPDLESLQHKANVLAQSWSEKWEKVEEKRLKQEQRENSEAKAEELTEEAELALEEVNNILNHTLRIDDNIKWEKLKSRIKYGVPHPERTFLKKKELLKPPIEEVKDSYPPQPDQSSPLYNPGIGFLDKLISSRKQKKLEEAARKYDKDLEQWRTTCDEIDRVNKWKDDNFRERVEQYNAEIKKLDDEMAEAIKDWEARKANYETDQIAYNTKIDHWKKNYFQGDEIAILEYNSQVLNNSEYPDAFPQTFELMYQQEAKILVVEYQLPRLRDLPTLKEVRYIQTKKELKETHLPESQVRTLYDKVLYEIAIRTVHEIFEADQGNWIDAVAFNGWVKEVNPATGKEVNNCVMTLHVKKDVFIEIDLSKIEPKTCFKGLKGVAASKLNALTPVQPILTMVKDDPRFVDSYKVIEKVEKGDNLAAMDWEDFEHLIREIFEKEFSSSGGEVKITQASRDGGVDAVAFDPDPIKGGKIVIQAKRYSNTVGVSAVRDLYGTVMNEGATKGILVTTADYGPDAYEFAKGKPLTLLNGSNLLSLLSKHGHEARIDLQEAKAIMKEK